MIWAGCVTIGGREVVDGRSTEGTISCKQTLEVVNSMQQITRNKSVNRGAAKVEFPSLEMSEFVEARWESKVDD